uniref:PWI domain-containing protein n=1 Tax=Steinernema glaseri TaxID=37863 RepID=A0A1I7YD68_9BILA
MNIGFFGTAAAPGIYLNVPFGAQPQFFVQPPHVTQRPAPGASAAPFDNKPPVTTLFVGNICDKAEDDLVKSLLQECGPVSTWKRIQGPNGKLQAFGFCEFDHPDGTLRALRVLNDFQLGNKKLVVKVEDKTKALIREFLVKRRESKGLPVDQFGDDLPVDEDTVKDDDVVKERITKLIESSQPDLLEDVDDGELPDKDDDQKDKDSASSKRKFRALILKAANLWFSSVSTVLCDPGEGGRGHVRFWVCITCEHVPEFTFLECVLVDQSPSRRKRSRSRSRSVNGKRRKHRRSRSKDKKTKRRRSESGSESSSRSSSTSSRRSAKGSKAKSDSKSRRDRDDSEDSDDARERRALKKKLKEKEQSYLTRLKKWESRERRMAKHYEREEVNDNTKQKMRQSEIKKLKQFLEDYDDDRDDPKYFNMNAKGSTLYQRKRLYEREREQDAKDRQREQEEIEELKKAILEENKNIENVDEEAKKRHQMQEEEALRKHRENSGSPNPHLSLGQKMLAAASAEANGEGSASPSGSASNDAKVAGDGVMKIGGWATVNSEGTPTQSMSPAPAAFSKPSTAAATSIVSSSTVKKPNVSARLNGVFGVDDDEDDQIVGMMKKKPLKPFEITQEDRMQAMTAEERKKMIRDLIERIPTQKEDLFAYPIQWSFVDEDLVKSRIRPWVSKKILEYIGEEETSLVDFVCEKVSAQSPPNKLLRDIAMVLDEEAEIFVVKMWRLLIYESESKRLGIPAKSSSS